MFTSKDSENGDKLEQRNGNQILTLTEEGYQRIEEAKTAIDPRLEANVELENYQLHHDVLERQQSSDLTPEALIHVRKTRGQQPDLTRDSIFSGREKRGKPRNAAL